MTQPAQLIFRRLTGDDTSALVPCYCEYMREFGHPASAEDYSPFLRDLLESPWIIGTAGFVGVEVHAFALGSSSYSSIRRCKAVLLSDVFVIRPLRGQRVVHRLLAAMYDECRSSGIQRLFGNVEHTTTNFFLRSGWRATRQAFLTYDLTPLDC